MSSSVSPRRFKEGVSDTEM